MPSENHRLLHANQPVATDCDTWKSLEQANASLKAAFPESITPSQRQQLLYHEASFSSAIEDVYQEELVSAHHAALTDFLDTNLSPQSLLRLHTHIMLGQPHAQPGTYRTLQVFIGDQTPPPPEDVPALMDEFFSYATKRGLNPIAQAAFAHLCFEHIHPFADGNGRTGRAIINHVLNSPIPLSQYMLTHRRSYYRHLAQGHWTEYINWFVKGVLHLSDAPPHQSPNFAS